jgi:hypothetical protein
MTETDTWSRSVCERQNLLKHRNREFCFSVRAGSFRRKKRNSTGVTRRPAPSGQSTARTRLRVSAASTKATLEASVTGHQHVHARPAVGTTIITSTEPGRKATASPAGGSGPAKRLRLRLGRLTKSKHRCAYEPLARMVCDHCGSETHGLPEMRDAQRIARCARHQDIDRSLAHARSASVANARQSDIRHAIRDANVDH